MASSGTRETEYMPANATKIVARQIRKTLRADQRMMAAIISALPVA